VALLVRTWNLFHGNAHPPERRAYLEEMVRLATADAPDVVCLQEVPLWALRRLERWSGMRAVADVAARSRLGPMWEAGRVVTDFHPGVLRSLLTGQANVILLARRFALPLRALLVLNPRNFRRSQRGPLALETAHLRKWRRNRRICQAVRIQLPDESTAIVANVHATAGAAEHIPTAELVRVADWLDGLARSGEPLIVCGDFNVRGAQLTALRERGFSEPSPGIDHVLVRGAAASPPLFWPEERRRVGGRLLSDHPPVELEAAIG
jgi:endonuclease/exonuclease/phosphatase family metal-dependent hydrolase